MSCLFEVLLELGMILSNEPGYYREGVFGICIENLIAVILAFDLFDGDVWRMLVFEMLMLVPIDRWMIDVVALLPEDCAWLDTYYVWVRIVLAGKLSFDAVTWLDVAIALL